MRLGYFGGSFDPVHNGHIRTAEDILAAQKVDAIVFLPAGIPPHKRSRSLTSGSLRMEMVAAAIGSEPRFSIDARELADTSPSYTVKTLEAVRRERPTDDLYFIIGMDTLKDLGSWFRIERIVELARFLVVRRPGTHTNLAKARAAAIPNLRYEIVDACAIDVSSSEIRAAVAENRPIDRYVPESVRAIIEREKLYRDK